MKKLKMIVLMVLLSGMSLTSSLYAATSTTTPSNPAAPTTCITYPDQMYVGDTVTVTDCSTSPDGVITKMYLGIWMNGSLVRWGGGNPNITTLSFTITTPGTYNFTNLVTNASTPNPATDGTFVSSPYTFV
ncbi:MAG: hypothetical protein ACC656_12515, partial [Candidatus Heimdallarchaeota archaeon]